ncbi:PrpF, AcnD-accessory [Mycolicibacterium sp. 018/SC-01/001]|uniref:PrpF domain-containing protein n=1 Tax=Mycolicibacterium sp. 018/SC-01/001 TaxID=2592069 RepID=UPI00117DD788|nr:PrpF domain-containing protein [Mycolicibacterium sp. 018/SC-01/001]TRW88987.1 PrpF, AcnD-accessory [Mycolicibacterium sp. 018/SC-01/001]
MLTLRGTWMRGGTSKCWLFNAVDVDPLVRRDGDLDRLLSSAFGSGDPAQLDGVGGGSSTTSKAAVVRRSAVPGIDIDYLFAQVAIGRRAVEWGSNCGNCATAIGLYALQSGLVPVAAERTVVRMRNQNTGAVLTAEIDTPDGRIPTEGTAAVPGTTALGVPVALTFDAVVPSAAALLPSGAAVDALDAAGRRFDATLVSAGAPAALFDAGDFAMTGAEGNDSLAERLPVLIELRRQAALRMGLARADDPVSHAVPKVGIVSPALPYRTTSGECVDAADYDVSVRMVSMMAPHPSIGLTSAVAIAAAATVGGSTVARHVGTAVPGRLRIGTAAGVVHATYTRHPDGRVDAVSLHRAARRIATAELYVADTAAAFAGAP